MRAGGKSEFFASGAALYLQLIVTGRGCPLLRTRVAMNPTALETTYLPTEDKLLVVTEWNKTCRQRNRPKVNPRFSVCNNIQLQLPYPYGEITMIILRQSRAKSLIA